VGRDARVGHAVEVKRSVLLPGATAGHLAYVGDSVVGHDANLGAGTVVANLRHDGADVRVTVKGERVSTGRRKFGAVVGPGAKTGIDTSLAPGVTLGADATTAPGETLLRDRADGAGPG
jgi:bifunctional UDP-N-acetylglucosamine pyrophosphorylase/glucosamine-1-phosphate N-acetyltransferase